MSAGGPEERVPPPGEEIHIPGPTILPFLSAAGITGIVIGTTIWWVWSLVGGIVLVVCVFKWVSDTSRDVASLPEEHTH
jgi:xanthosine utilization system XapX-like protein